jgi:hypothetical protein
LVLFSAPVPMRPGGGLVACLGFLRKFYGYQTPGRARRVSFKSEMQEIELKAERITKIETARLLPQ